MIDTPSYALRLPPKLTHNEKCFTTDRCRIQDVGSNTRCSSHEARNADAQHSVHVSDSSQPRLAETNKPTCFVLPALLRALAPRTVHKRCFALDPATTARVQCIAVTPIGDQQSLCRYCTSRTPKHQQPAPQEQICTTHTTRGNTTPVKFPPPKKNYQITCTVLLV